MEKLATWYLALEPLRYWLTVYGVMCVGGLFGWLSSLWSGRPARLDRSPYFVRLCLVMLFVSLAELAALKAAEAVAWKVAPRLALFLIAVAFIGGASAGRAAAARSRAAFGHGRAAPLAFIPIANLWLLFKPSRIAVAPRFGLTRGEEGAVFGLILLVITGGVIALEVAQMKVPPDYTYLMKAMNTAFIKGEIREKGLEKALEAEAGSVIIGSDYNADYNHDAVRVEQNVITYTLKANRPGHFASPRIQAERRSSLCARAGNAEYLRAGAVFRTVFLDSDGREEATMTTSARECGALPSMMPWWALSLEDFR